MSNTLNAPNLNIIGDIDFSVSNPTIGTGVETLNLGNGSDVNIGITEEENNITIGSALTSLQIKDQEYKGAYEYAEFNDSNSLINSSSVGDEFWRQLDSTFSTLVDTDNLFNSSEQSGIQYIGSGDNKIIVTASISLQSSLASDPNLLYFAISLDNPPSYTPNNGQCVSLNVWDSSSGFFTTTIQQSFQIQPEQVIKFYLGDDEIQEFNLSNFYVHISVINR